MEAEIKNGKGRNRQRGGIRRNVNLSCDVSNVRTRDDVVGEDGGELGLVGQDGLQGGGVDLSEGLVRGGEHREGTGALQGVDQAVMMGKKRRGEKSCVRMLVLERTR